MNKYDEYADVLNLMIANKDSIRKKSDIISMNDLYNRAKFIVDHDREYNYDERKKIMDLGLEMKPFTQNQKEQLQYSSLHSNSYENDSSDYIYNDCADSDEDRRWAD